MKRWLLPAAQKIAFAPDDQAGQNGDNYQACPQLRDRAGTTVTDGLTARAFATSINLVALLLRHRPQAAARPEPRAQVHA